MLYPGKCFGILQFYICLASLYKIICLQFFICILLSVLLFYAFVTRESPSVSPLLCYITQNSESACFRTPYSSGSQPVVRGGGPRNVFRGSVRTLKFERQITSFEIFCCLSSLFEMGLKICLIACCDGTIQKLIEIYPPQGRPIVMQ